MPRHLAFPQTIALRNKSWQLWPYLYIHLPYIPAPGSKDCSSSFSINSDLGIQVLVSLLSLSPSQLNQPLVESPPPSSPNSNMVEVNKLLPLLRTIVFGACSLSFSGFFLLPGLIIFFFRMTVATSVTGLAVLAMSAHIVSWTNSIVSGAYFQYAALALATGLLTVLSLPAM